MQVVNASVPSRSYWAVVLASMAVTQQLSCVVAAGAVPLHLHSGRLSAGSMLAACGALLALGGSC
jgi:phosphatidylinositol glycan class C protein